MQFLSSFEDYFYATKNDYPQADQCSKVSNNHPRCWFDCWVSIWLKYQLDWRDQFQIYFRRGGALVSGVYFDQRLFFIAPTNDMSEWEPSKWLFQDSTTFVQEWIVLRDMPWNITGKNIPFQVKKCPFYLSSLRSGQPDDQGNDHREPALEDWTWK